MLQNETPFPVKTWHVCCGELHEFEVEAGISREEALLRHQAIWLGKIVTGPGCGRLWEESDPNTRSPLIRTSTAALRAWLPYDIEPLLALLKARYEQNRRAR